MPQHRILLFALSLSILLNCCTSPTSSASQQLFKKEKTSITFTSFFVEKGNRDIENLSLSVEMSPSKTLNQPLKKEGCAIVYDKEDEKKTSESLNAYLKNLKDYTRYVFDFSFDSIKCKVFASEKYDILHIIAWDKASSQYRYLQESYFVYGTILKIIEKEVKGNNGDFDGVVPEKTRQSLFDENKLFYKSEQKATGEERILKYNDDDAFQQMQDAFLFRQFCRDALLKLKELHPDWFQDMM